MARGRGARGPRFSPVTAPPVTVPTYSPVAGLTPEIVDALNLRKEAVDATKNATDQYEADVADFKNTMATEAEQGIASLPNIQFKKDNFLPPRPDIIEYVPKIVDDPRRGTTVDPRPDPMMGITMDPRPDPITGDRNPGVNSITYNPNISLPFQGFDPRDNEIRYNPFYEDDEGNIQRYKGPDRKFIEDIYHEERPPMIEEMLLPTVDITNNIANIPTMEEIERGLAQTMAGGGTDNINRPFDQTAFDYLNSGMGNPDNLSIEELIGMINIEPGDVQVPYNTGPKQSTPGNFYRGVFDSGTPVNRGRGRGPGTGGQGPYNPPPGGTPPPPPPSSGGLLDVIRKPKMYERPTSFESGAPTLVKAMSPRSFGTAPGFEPAPIPLPPTIDPPKKPPPKRSPRTFIDDQTPPRAKGGMYLGDSYLNKGLSQLPMNGQNDTLTTQVFQAGFRPRR